MNTFSAYSFQHLAPIVASILLIVFLLRLGKGRPISWQAKLGGYVSLLIPMMLTKDLAVQWITNSFQLAEDLPCHLCRLVCFLLPVAFFRQSRDWMGVLYFLVLAGTMQAIVTPDLKEGFPDYAYFRYWILHAGLVALTLYGIIALKVTPGWRDFGRSVIAAQIYLLLTLPLNYFVGGNYGYTCRKPPVASIADYMGPWPWYILTGEAIMLVLFLLLMLPFRLKGR